MADVNTILKDASVGREWLKNQFVMLVRAEVDDSQARLSAAIAALTAKVDALAAKVDKL